MFTRVLIELMEFITLVNLNLSGVVLKPLSLFHNIRHKSFICREVFLFTLCYGKFKLMSVFHTSVLLLTMNLVITLSK